MTKVSVQAQYGMVPTVFVLQKERASKMEALRRDEEEWEKRRGIGQMVFERWLKVRQRQSIRFL